MPSTNEPKFQPRAKKNSLTKKRRKKRKERAESESTERSRPRPSELEVWLEAGGRWHAEPPRVDPRPRQSAERKRSKWSRLSSFPLCLRASGGLGACLVHAA